ncbi:MAG: UDP-N-acetylmuramoyl-tripeptide--D-alanyl-D-alanine ligase [Lachnospiraceae bacterium]|nr:UDP-N-acetylmuramoyl-tripeptide--D-alanyl-D-alanine ligase [Lachnospiraceae bacterium]
MKNMTLGNIAKACGGTFIGTQQEEGIEVSGISIDSRTIQTGGLFVATRGARTDGHLYIDDVIGKGAAAVVSEQDLGSVSYPYIRVEDSFDALKKMAAFYRIGLDIKVVGITGSVGKTSTKEMIASVLSTKYQVQKTDKNFNNEVGLPLTIFTIGEEHEVAVLEMGISDFGEMTRLAQIAKPDICVITNIGQCHLENLKTRDGVLKAKTEIFTGMSEDGEAVLCGDDDKLLTVQSVNGRPAHYFTRLQKENAEVYASGIVSRGLFGSDCTIHTRQGSFDVHIPLLGEHMVSNALAAATVGLLLGLSLPQIREGIEKVKALPGRSRVVETGQYVVIDDCYNANPVSMRAALDVLMLAEGRRVAVIGSMFELGQEQERLHDEIGAYAAAKGIDVIVALGELGRHIYEGAKAAGQKQLFYYENAEEFLKHKGEILQAGDTILVKASHGMHLERIVEELEEAGK